MTLRSELTSVINGFIRKFERFKRFKMDENSLFHGLSFLCAASSIIAILFITVFVGMEGLKTFFEVSLDNLLSVRWAPYYGSYGIIPLIVGSLTVVAGALLISVPLGISSAVFITQFIPKNVHDIVKAIIEILAAIPSVVYGFIGLIFISPYLISLLNVPTGKIALNGMIILSLMVIPTITSISSEIMSSVPKDYIEASLALGATKWQTIRGVILPTSMPGMIASIILAFGRAIGETVAVLIVCGSVAKIPVGNIFLNPVYPLTAAIAMYMGEAVVGSTFYHVLYTLGLFLFIITFAATTLADFIIAKYTKALRRIVI
ncbi:phosphate ABC transporter permease subunit PstC [archaeon]|nr:MAG: phosphate ABC transporter permease subunit PstC [archaeon]RLG64961.1 MAG: phosphate ABC transporter permease subunit PstC [archaeon]